jgi:UDP-glucose 4-epimerase
MPTGPMNRVADNGLAKRLLGWEPKIKFMEGLRQTADWYFSKKDRGQVAATLERLLTERTHSPATRAIERIHSAVAN